jgi:transcriptional regulator with XRE-family HTH domain
MGKNSFGEILERLLRQNNLSGRQFAKDVGINNKTVSSWIGEGGSFPSDPMVIKKIAIRFNISVHELLYGEPDPRSLLGELLNKTEMHTGLYEITIKKLHVK